MSGPSSSRSRLRLRVSPAAEAQLRAGHPWLYADSVRGQNRPGDPGELGVVYDRRDRFLAIGLYDPASPLRLRALHSGQPVTVDAGWWAARLGDALDRREGLFGEDTDGYRLINGESDGWPGLVLDRYAEVLVLKLYTAAWFPWLPTVLPLLAERFPGFAVVLRLSRNVQEAARLQGLADGDVLVGEAPPGPVVFRESGLRFEADVRRGQKTGFFLDQRENRRRVEGLSQGRRVLNAFSFSGGFSLYAARGGAASVLSLDLSRHALEAVDRNFALNPGLAPVPQRAEQADVFSWLGTARESFGPGRFGLIVLDPPSLARRESERAGAIRAYTRLAADALRLLEPGGVLFSASCSAHVAADEFYEAVRSAVRASGRRADELALTGHAPDHPAGFLEAQYLKAMFLRVE